jgi:signal transduction histidine kinase
MNFYAGSAFAAYFFTVIVGIVTWRKASDRQLGKFFGLVSLAVSFWVLGCFGESFASQRYALFFDVLLYCGACFAPVLFLHFVLTFAEQTERYRKFLLFNYAVSTFFVILNIVPAWRHLFILGVPRKFPYRFIADPNTLWYLFAAWYLLPVTVLNVILFKGAFLDYPGPKTKQYRSFVFAASLLAVAGGMYFALVFTLNMPPIDNFFTTAYGLIMSYAILNRQFMDIRLILRDTTVHVVTGVLLAFGSLVVGFPLILLNSYMAVFVTTVLMGLLMAFAYDPIRRAIQPAIDRVVFSNRFGYLEELSQLPNDMLEFSNLNEMLKFLVTRLKKAARLESVRIFMYDPGHQNFQETIVDETPSTQKAGELSESGALFALLKQEGRLWMETDFERWKTPEASRALAELREFNGVACFPVNKEKDLLGVVILGRKSSGALFNQQDLKILQALRVRLENFLGQAMTITQEALNMVKDSHDMKNDVNALKGRVSWRAMQIASWKQEFEKQIPVMEQAFALGSPDARAAFEALKKHALEWFQEAERSRTIEDQAIQRLTHRLKNWAEYGRVVAEGFRGSRSMQAIEVSEAARLSIERWRPHAEKKGLQLVLDAREPFWVWGERSLVEQIIENLTDNAIKATNEGRVEVRCRSDREGVLIEVRDTGCGIPAEDLATIFEKPFYQGRGRETLEQSTGVGLYLVAQYVRSLGGRVRAESRVGKGSSFFVHLPRYNQTGKEVAA